MYTVILVTALILIQYQYFSTRTGFGRGKTIKAPAMTGDEIFERKLRVQLNTLENLVITLPAMWMCAVYFRTDVAAILGTIFIIGRFVYSAAYIKNPESRTAGFLIGWFANLALLACCLYIAIANIF